MYQIGLAFSSDGKRFRRLPAEESPYQQAGLAVLAKTALTGVRFDLGIVSDPMVVLKDGTHHLWFSSFALKGTTPVINGTSCAVSKDGITWSFHPGNPVIPEVGMPTVLWNPVKQRFEMRANLEEPERAKVLPYKDIATYATTLSY